MEIMLDPGNYIRLESEETQYWA